MKEVKYKLYEITWEINPFRDEQGFLIETVKDYQEARNKKEASNSSFDWVSWEYGGGRQIKVEVAK